MAKRSALQRRALRELERVAKAAPSDRLHMNRVVDVAECGTARCLMGWAIIDPWFRKNTILGDVPEDYDAPGFPGVLTDSQKLGAVFGITGAQAHALFGANLSVYNTPPHAVKKQQVLSRIRRLQDGLSISPYPVPR